MTVSIAGRAMTVVTVAGLVLASTGPALAAPGPASPADFNAPMFATTATLTEGRMPTYQQIRCSDAKCTRGVLTAAEGGSTQYVSTTVARGGVFANSPYFVAKLNKHWSNAAANREAAGGPAADYSTFTINLAQIYPGADIPGLVTADLARYEDTTLSAPTTVDGATMWTATAKLNKGEYVMAYVSKGDALVRGVCVQFGKEQGSVTCPPANVEALTLGAAAAPASATLAEQGSIRGLVPATPPGLTPLFLNIEPTQPLWAANAPSPALVRALAQRKNSVALQYEVTKYPELLLDAKVAAVSSEAPARLWTDTICDTVAVSTTKCDLIRMTGPAFGYIGVRNDPEDGGRPYSVSSHFAGAGKLGDASCYAVRTDDALKPAEVSACKKAITALATAMAK